MGIGRVLVTDRSPVPIAVSEGKEVIKSVWERESEVGSGRLYKANLKREAQRISGLSQST